MRKSLFGIGIGVLISIAGIFIGYKNDIHVAGFEHGYWLALISLALFISGGCIVTAIVLAWVETKLVEWKNAKIRNRVQEMREARKQRPK